MHAVLMYQNVLLMEKLVVPACYTMLSLHCTVLFECSSRLSLCNQLFCLLAFCSARPSYFTEDSPLHSKAGISPAKSPLPGQILSSSFHRPSCCLSIHGTQSMETYWRPSSQWSSSIQDPAYFSNITIIPYSILQISMVNYFSLLTISKFFFISILDHTPPLIHIPVCRSFQVQSLIFCIAKSHT